MNKYKIVLLLFLVFENYTCKYTSAKFGQQNSRCTLNESNKEKIPVTFSELVQQAYFFRNNDNLPELCRLLNDSILSCKKRTWFWTISNIDTVNKCISWKFKQVNPELYLGERASDRFFFRVCITTENDIFTTCKIDNLFNQFCKNNIATIKQQAIEYLFYPEEEDKHIIIERHNIELIGEIEVARTGVLFSRDARNGLTVDEWKLFFDCLHELMLAFEEERNRKSIEIWGVEYHSLSYEKMDALTNIVDYNIIIDFFQTMYSYCNPPPPPPNI